MLSTSLFRNRMSNLGLVTQNVQWLILMGTSFVVATYLQGRQGLEAVSRDGLRRRLAEGATEVLDVRPAVEYRQGHIAGARSIPVDELEERLHELDPTWEIVAYCRGPYCVFADEAVTLLRGHGYTAARYDEGYPEWAAAGLPVAQEDLAAGA